MASTSHTEMHRDHTRWKNDDALWREEIAIWEREVDHARMDLPRVAKAVRAHAAKLQSMPQQFVFLNKTSATMNTTGPHTSAVTLQSS